MTTRELLGIVQDRGLRIVVKDGRPVLVRPNNKADAVTDNLLAVLTLHRERIVEHLRSRL